MMREEDYTVESEPHGFNCTGPHMCEFFSIVGTIIYDLWLVRSENLEP